MRRDYSEHFDLGGTNWINTAHQGAIPLAAATAAKQAVDWKLDPTKLTSERFSSVPARLRSALATLNNAPDGEVALANAVPLVGFADLGNCLCKT